MAKAENSPIFEVGVAFLNETDFLNKELQKMNCSHQQERPSGRNNSGSALSAILLAILPKCPICFVTLSSSITICGLGPSENSAISKGLVLMLLLIVLLSLLFSYRGIKTVFALILLAAGTGVIFWGGLQLSNLTGYYLGAALVVIASLVNRRALILKSKNSAAPTPGRIQALNNS